MSSIPTSSVHSDAVKAIINSAAKTWDEMVAAMPDIDPIPDYAKTHRVFAWVVMYLAEKQDVIAALKYHYSDVCSGGDLCMKELIAFLEQDDNSHAAATALYKSKPVVKYYWDICWGKMQDTLKVWLDKGTLDADPFWAD